RRQPIDQWRQIADALAGQRFRQTVHVRHDVNPEPRIRSCFLQNDSRVPDEIGHYPALEIAPFAESMLADPLRLRPRGVQSGSRQSAGRLLEFRERCRVEARVQGMRSTWTKFDFPVEGPAHEIEKDPVNWIRACDGADYCEHVFLTPLVSRGHPHV